MGFKDIEYDIPVYQIKNTQIHDYTNMQIHKYKVLKRPYILTPRIRYSYYSVTGKPDVMVLAPVMVLAYVAMT